MLKGTSAGQTCKDTRDLMQVILLKHMAEDQKEMEGWAVEHKDE